MIASLLNANRGMAARRPLIALACAALALAGCGNGAGATRNAGHSAPVAKAATRTAPAPVALQSSCAPPPNLALPQDFTDPRHAFAPATAAFHRLETNFALAYRGACERGVLRGRALIPAGAAEHDRLLLKNAPDANLASIYLDGEEGAPRATRHMVLEFPFLTADGAAHAPTGEELGEAIFCAVHGASQQEEDESGRCLPD
jgi:hypothetical protein